MIAKNRIFLQSKDQKVVILPSEKNAEAIIICQAKKKPAIEAILLSFLNEPALIIIDFQDIISLLKNNKTVAAGYGRQYGPNHTFNAAREAMLSVIKTAGKADKKPGAILVHFSLSKDTRLSAVTTAMEFLLKNFPPDIKLFYGQGYEESADFMTKCLILIS